MSTGEIFAEDQEPVFDWNMFDLSRETLVDCFHNFSRLRQDTSDAAQVMYDKDKNYSEDTLMLDLVTEDDANVAMIFASEPGAVCRPGASCGIKFMMGVYLAGEYIVYPDHLDDYPDADKKAETIDRIKVAAMSRRADFLEGYNKDPSAIHRPRLAYEEEKIVWLHQTNFLFFTEERINSLLTQYNFTPIEDDGQGSMRPPEQAVYADEHTRALLGVHHLYNAEDPSEPTLGLTVTVFGAYEFAHGKDEANGKIKERHTLHRQHMVNIPVAELDPNTGSVEIVSDIIPEEDLEGYMELVSWTAKIKDELSEEGLVFNAERLGVIAPPTLA